MKKKAFTLVELLIVIVIIGILATLVTLALSSATRKAKDSKAKTAVEQVQKAVLAVMAADTATPIPDTCANGGWADVSGSCSSALGEFSVMPVGADGSAARISTPSDRSGDTYVIAAKGTNGKCWYVTQTLSGLTGSAAAGTAAAGTCW